MTERVYLIHWYGPFSSVEKLESWEKEQSFTCNLYLFQGKLKYGRFIKYYCGMTYEQNGVYARMKNKDHHIHEVEGRPETIAIYVGEIANVIEPDKDDVRLCEKLLTSILAKFIKCEKEVINKTNKKPPKRNVYVINEWYDENLNETIQHKGEIPHFVPDLIEFFAGTRSVYSVNRIKYKGQL